PDETWIAVWGGMGDGPQVPYEPNPLTGSASAGQDDPRNAKVRREAGRLLSRVAGTGQGSVRLEEVGVPLAMIGRVSIGKRDAHDAQLGVVVENAHQRVAVAAQLEQLADR